MDCSKAHNCSVGGAVEAVGLGALGGALGAGLAGPLGGRLVSEALDGVLPQAATQGLVGAGSGAVSGGVTALAGYGMNCGRSCSVSGALSAAGSGALIGGVGGAAFGALGGLRARGRSSSEEPTSCAVPHSFLAGTKVLLADGSSKAIASLKVGDRVANSQPGKAGLEAHPVDRVIVTETDHDFVDLKVKPSRVRRAVGRVAAGVALAAVVAGGAVPASASAATVTTTYHHPFYDVTRGGFVDAVDLQVGDHLQTADGGEADVVEVTPYHSTEVTYDLTIDQLHTYYVLAGDTPVLVHNCTPLGFEDHAAFEDFGARLKAGLADAGHSDVDAAFQGSSVTGRSFRTGKPFDEGRTSDYDVALAGEDLLAAAKEAGINLRGGGVRTGPLKGGQLAKLGLADLQSDLSEVAGRPVNFMIFNTIDSAISRSPSIMVK
jgi:hypothetical protein